MSPLNDTEIENSPSIEELISKGRRDLLCLEVHSAVEHFQHACELIAEQKGDFHDDLAEPNFLYGTALLELARSENQIFNEAIKNPDPEDSSEDEEVESIKNENGTAKINDNLNELNNGYENGESLTINSNDKDGVLEEKESVPNDANDDQENEDAEEVSTLQLAWEVIEVAKALFQKHSSDESKLKVADCLEKLGEISCEKEDHEQAISDLLECLELRLKYAATNERLIAETYFQLAVAYSLLNNKIASNAAFSKALECLDKHKLKLELSLKNLPNVSDTEKLEARRIEMQIKEVSQIISEVTERQKDNNEAVNAGVGNEESKKHVTENTPAADITHLIKKKRPMGDSIDEAKKAKLEAITTNNDT